MNLKYMQKVTISFSANIFRRSRSHYQLPLKTMDISREDGKHQPRLNIDIKRQCLMELPLEKKSSFKIISVVV